MRSSCIVLDCVYWSSFMGSACIVLGLIWWPSFTGSSFIVSWCVWWPSFKGSPCSVLGCVWWPSFQLGDVLDLVWWLKTRKKLQCLWAITLCVESLGPVQIMWLPFSLCCAGHTHSAHKLVILKLIIKPLFFCMLLKYSQKACLF